MSVAFKHQHEIGHEPDFFRLPWSYPWELCRDGRTPIRAITDEAMKYYHRFLECDGTIYELSAPNDYYKSFYSKHQKYVTTNYRDNADMVVDMTDMPFQDNSVDAMLSMFALEHIENYQQALLEVHRSLKPGGRFLMAVPFLYYYHAAPDDYIRFTTSYLSSLLSKFDILSMQTLGNRALLIGQVFHEKPWMNKRSGSLTRLCLRLFAGLATSTYILRPERDTTFYSAVIILVEKRNK